MPTIAAAAPVGHPPAVSEVTRLDRMMRQALMATQSMEVVENKRSTEVALMACKKEVTKTTRRITIDRQERVIVRSKN